MAVRGRYFQGLLYIVKKGCEKGKIAGYGGKTVVVLPMKSPGMGWGFLRAFAGPKVESWLFPEAGGGGGGGVLGYK